MSYNFFFFEQTQQLYLTKAIILSCITAINHKIYDCGIVGISLIYVPINNRFYFNLNISQTLVN